MRAADGAVAESGGEDTGLPRESVEAGSPDRIPDPLGIRGEFRVTPESERRPPHLVREDVHHVRQLRVAAGDGHECQGQ